MLLLAFGNAAVAVAEQTAPSGLWSSAPCGVDLPRSPPSGSPPVRRGGSEGKDPGPLGCPGPHRCRCARQRALLPGANQRVTPRRKLRQRCDHIPAPRGNAISATTEPEIHLENYRARSSTRELRTTESGDGYAPWATNPDMCRGQPVARSAIRSLPRKESHNAAIMASRGPRRQPKKNL
jgi:hypothetical protein